MTNLNREQFWKLRASQYNNLRWVKDDKYLNKFVTICNPRKTDLVLDVGTGSGAVAKALKQYVKHVIGLDISVDMMSYNDWEGMSKICNDILTPLFRDNIFDLITARMVFHHIQDTARGIKICYNLLKPQGKLVIAESVPPSDDKKVVKWWSYVRTFKEQRQTFSEAQLLKYFEQAGFKKIRAYYYYQSLKSSSTREWLQKSKLPVEIQTKIYNLHKNASQNIKLAHKMKITKDDIYCIHRHLIMIGTKYGK